MEDVLEVDVEPEVLVVVGVSSEEIEAVSLVSG